MGKCYREYRRLEGISRSGIYRLIVRIYVRRSVTSIISFETRDWMIVFSKSAGNLMDGFQQSIEPFYGRPCQNRTIGARNGPSLAVDMTMEEN